MSNSLKSQATRGMMWVAIEKFALQGGQFVIGIVLARLLMPKDFGLIGMLSVFIAIAQSFIDSGMGTGLIQKRDRTDVDFSTVFVFNFAVSVLFYIILYFSAPLIAGFYNTPKLIPLTRILTLNIVINSLAIVQRSRLTINLDFKKIAKVNVASVIAGGVIGIIFAFVGFGVWALVIKTIAISIVSVIMFWYLSYWRPSISFSKQSFQQLFGFGSKLLIAGIYAKIFQNLYNIVIGKYHSASDLGFYTQAKRLVDLTSGTVTEIMHKVTFPILASLNDNQTRMISVYGRIIRMTSFFIFPLMTLLSLLADPIIRVLLNDNWLPVIPLMQLLCFARIFYPISAVNMNILNANGRSDLFLKVDLAKAPITLIALLITVPLGVKAMVMGFVVSSWIAFIINAYMPGRLFGYGVFKQLKDMLPFFFATAIMAGAVYGSIMFIENSFLKLVIGGMVGLISYTLVNYILKTEELGEAVKLIKKIGNKILCFNYLVFLLSLEK